MPNRCLCRESCFHACLPTRLDLVLYYWLSQSVKSTLHNAEYIDDRNLSIPTDCEPASWFLARHFQNPADSFLEGPNEIRIQRMSQEVDGSKADLTPDWCSAYGKLSNRRHNTSNDCCPQFHEVSDDFKLSLSISTF